MREFEMLFLSRIYQIKFASFEPSSITAAFHPQAYTVLQLPTKSHQAQLGKMMDDSMDVEEFAAPALVSTSSSSSGQAPPNIEVPAPTSPPAPENNNPLEVATLSASAPTSPTHLQAPSPAVSQKRPAPPDAAVEDLEVLKKFKKDEAVKKALATRAANKAAAAAAAAEAATNKKGKK